MLLFITKQYGENPMETRFNTSHVTLYRYLEFVQKVQEAFQYISCYSLSQANPARSTRTRRFNTSHVTLYLWKGSYLFWYPWCFNTSHVTLYHHSGDSTEMVKHRFNTSHVTLYPNTDSHRSFRESSFNTSHVTLYLKAPLSAENAIPFQYISCYSLSSRKT